MRIKSKPTGKPKPAHEVMRAKSEEDVKPELPSEAEGKSKKTAIGDKKKKGNNNKNGRRSSSSKDDKEKVKQAIKKKEIKDYTPRVMAAIKWDLDDDQVFRDTFVQKLIPKHLHKKKGRPRKVKEETKDQENAGVAGEKEVKEEVTNGGMMTRSGRVRQSEPAGPVQTDKHDSAPEQAESKSLVKSNAEKKESESEEAKGNAGKESAVKKKVKKVVRKEAQGRKKKGGVGAPISWNTPVSMRGIPKCKPKRLHKKSGRPRKIKVEEEKDNKGSTCKDSNQEENEGKKEEKPAKSAPPPVGAAAKLRRNDAPIRAGASYHIPKHLQKKPGRPRKAEIEKSIVQVEEEGGKRYNLRAVASKRRNSNTNEDERNGKKSKPASEGKANEIIVISDSEDDEAESSEIS